MRVRYLIEFVELFPLFLCAAASNRADVQHAITELNECPPVKHYTLQPGHYYVFYTFKCYTTFTASQHSSVPIPSRLQNLKNK